MKNIRRISAIIIAILLLVATAVPAMAQDKDSGKGGNAMITVNNPAKGKTYTLYKLFDATTDGTNISYTGDIPASLASFFNKDASGNITVNATTGLSATGDMSDALRTALAEWAKTATASVTETSDGSTEINFQNLPYGYYVMTTDNVDKSGVSQITVTSTKPNASIFDKNTNEPSAKKTVEKASYSIGDTIKYTATFNTTNYMGTGTRSKQVVEYEITDTLPEFLSNVEVKSIKVNGTAITTQQFNNKKIIIPWATKVTGTNNYTSLYPQDAVIEIIYEAKLTSVTNINGPDKNRISIRPYVDDGNGGKEPWNEHWEDTSEIITYGAAIRKVDGEGNDLAGATFKVKGLQVTGSAGEYTVVSYDPNSTEDSIELECTTDGELYILGLDSNVSLTVTEFKAPDGYNLLSGTVSLTPQVLNHKIYKTTGTVYYDADGNVIRTASSNSEKIIKNVDRLRPAALEVVNRAGTELPSTGGMGTTLLYVVGAALVLGAGIVLIARRKAGSKR